MKLDLILIIGMVVNILFVVLYPTQILGDDPLGLNGIQEDKLRNYYTVNNTGAINDYDETTNTVKSNNDLVGQLAGGVTSTDGDAGILTTEVLSFADWLKVGWNLMKTMMMFVVGFIYLLLTLAYPFNLLIGVPFALLYVFSMAAFIIGRS